MSELPDHYAILGVHPEAEDEVIAAAYRALAKKYHPDTGAKGTASSTRFMEVNEAFEVLRDPDRRKAYDEERRFRSSNMGDDQAGGDDENAAAPEAQENSHQHEPTKAGDIPKKSERNSSPVATTLVWGAVVIASTVALVEFSKERSAPGQTADRAAPIDPADTTGQPVANVVEKGSLVPATPSKDDARLNDEVEALAGQSPPTEQRRKELYDRIVGDQVVIGGQMMPTEEIQVQRPVDEPTLIPLLSQDGKVPFEEGKDDWRQRVNGPGGKTGIMNSLPSVVTTSEKSDYLEN